MELSVSVYQKPEKISSLLSRSRVRIFYKGLNRNRTFITDEVADQLINSLPYVPIKGIYEDEDFTDHGKKRSEGKAYGVVPESCNFSWEKHLDDDGIVREYACCDVLLWTGIYGEAEEIMGKPQSMEINPKTLKGEWVQIEGKRCYKISKAEFLGLQCLGEDVEPCFEGAAFYNTLTNYKELLEEIENYVKQIRSEKEMPIVDFKLSHEDVNRKIFDSLNVNFNEENGWVLDYGISKVYDDYALIFKYEDGKFYRCPYAKNDETNEVTLNELVECFIVDVTAEEYSSLENLRSRNNNTFEKVEEIYDNLESVTKNLEELQAANTELVAENNNYSAEKETLENEKAALMSELEELKTYKNEKISEEKNAAIAEFSSLLSAEEIKEITDKNSEYTVEELQKELSFAYFKKQKEANFSLGVPDIKGNDNLTAVERLVKKYKA